jgi:hypothetical protein
MDLAGVRVTAKKSTNRQELKRDMGRRILAFLASLVFLLPVYSYAQRGRGGNGPANPRQNAALDLTGYWVSVITEDWKFRMVTPNKGIYETLTLNAEGRRVADTWDPAKDEAAGEQCRAYGAANIMRLPGRLHMTWQDDNTLKIETDTGTQTRLFHFGAGPPPAVEPGLQGYSQAQWEYAAGAGRGAGPRVGNLRVVTTNLKAGYVRKNGAPYSAKATVTEYYDLNTLPNGDQWLTVTTRVEDPVYFTRPLLTSSDFKKLPNSTGWNPTPCSVK